MERYSQFLHITKTLEILSKFQFDRSALKYLDRLKIETIENQFKIKDDFKNCILVPLKPKKAENEKYKKWHFKIEDIDFYLWDKIKAPNGFETYPDENHPIFY